MKAFGRHSWRGGHDERRRMHHTYGYRLIGNDAGVVGVVFGGCLCARWEMVGGFVNRWHRTMVKLIVSRPNHVGGRHIETVGLGGRFAGKRQRFELDMCVCVQGCVFCVVNVTAGHEPREIERTTQRIELVVDGSRCNRIYSTQLTHLYLDPRYSVG